MRLLTTAVTALRFISFPTRKPPTAGDVLFAGIGNHIHVYNAPNRDDPAVVKALLVPEVHIHGFSDASSDNYVAVHGGRVVALIRPLFTSDGYITDIELCNVRHFNDWVWDVTWVTPQSPVLVVATGHSKIFLCHRDFPRTSLRIDTDEEELTWSATTFQADDPRFLYAASGSSFGDILVWPISPVAAVAAQFCHDDARQQVRIHDCARPVHRLKAHAGPVMRIVVSNDARRMASASVDRCVRVWHVTPRSCPSCPTHGCFVPKFEHYGHLARVWDIAFLHPSYNCVVSVAEDRSCRLWSGREGGRQIAVYHAHAGRNVWTVAVASITGDGHAAIIATGGEDGSIKTRTIHGLWDKGLQNLAISDESPPVFTAVFELPDKLRNPRKTGGANDESGRTMLLVSPNVIIISTDFGRIMVAKLQRNAFSADAMSRDIQVKWTQLYGNPVGNAFTPSSLVRLNGIVCAGQTNGDVAVIPTQRDIEHGVIATGNAFQFCAFNDERHMVMGLFGTVEDSVNNSIINGNSNGLYATASWNDLFVAAPNGDLYHWCIRRVWNADAVDDKVEYKCIAVYQAHRTSKTTLVTNVCLLRERGVVVVGDKGGRLHLFRTPHNSAGDKLRTCRAESWLRVHKDRVSSIAQTGKAGVLTAGFDGRLARLAITNANGDKTKIEVERSERTAERADTIVQLFVQDAAARTVLAAFRGAILSIWDVEQRIELFRYDVGNWRRAHAVQLTEDGDVTVSFWRAGRMHVVRSASESTNLQSEANESRSARGSKSVSVGGAEFHGSRANDAVWVAADEFTVVTGGEDTTIRVTSIEGGTGFARLRWAQRMMGHVSSVSGVCVSKRGDIAASCGGSDEVLIWARGSEGAWRNITRARVGLMLCGRGAALSDERAAIMRMTGIDGGWECTSCGPACTAWAAGRSDGSIVLLHTTRSKDKGDGSSDTWRLSATMCGTHSDGAALSVCSVGGDSDSERILIVSGSSGGSVGVWDLNGRSVRLWAHVHAGGVDSVAAQWRRPRSCHGEDTRNATLVVASGGDDGRVRVCAVHTDVDTDADVEWLSGWDGGHHAAATSVAFIDGMDALVSVGADQRVLFWRVDAASHLDVRFAARRASAVPDPAAVCARIHCWQGVWRIVAVVCGYGLEVIEGPRVHRDLERPSDEVRWVLVDSDQT